LMVNGSQGGDIFDIDSTLAATTANGGASMNCFHVSPYTQYLADTINGYLTLNGSGADVLDFFDQSDPVAETFGFDNAPNVLTLESIPETIASFSGMGGGIYVMTNGFSMSDDQSGMVIFDPTGGPPCIAGGSNTDSVAGSEPKAAVRQRHADLSVEPRTKEEGPALAPLSEAQPAHWSEAAWMAALDDVLAEPDQWKL